MVPALVMPVMVMAPIVIDHARGQGLRDADQKQQGQKLRDVITHFFLRPLWNMTLIKRVECVGDPALLGQNQGLL